MVVHRRDGPILARHDEHLRRKEVVWRKRCTAKDGTNIEDVTCGAYHAAPKGTVV